MDTFTSTFSFTDEQIAAASHLELAFEHLLRNTVTHESIILSTCSIPKQRSKKVPADLGIGMAGFLTGVTSHAWSQLGKRPML